MRARPPFADYGNPEGITGRTGCMYLLRRGDIFLRNLTPEESVAYAADPDGFLTALAASRGS